MKAIMILLISILSLMPNCSYATSLKHELTLVQIEAFEEEIASFKKDVGRYPTSTEGLDILIENPDRINSWKGPYINKAMIPLDHWGNKYQYIFPAKYGNKEYDLYSFGKDKVDDHGQNDDITNWEKISIKHYYPARWKMQIILFCIVCIVLFFLVWKLSLRFKQR
jgi:general secretion pathway protein G